MPRESRRSSLLAGLAVAAAIVGYCAMRYGEAVGMFFFLDDFWVMRDADAAHHSPAPSWIEIFQPSHNGLVLYRPLSTIGYFYLLRQAVGLDASAYHAAHLLLFAGNGVLVACLARVLTGAWGWGLAAGLLYAAAPGHVLAVYWISTATITTTTTVVLLALLWWLLAPARWRTAGTVALQGVGLLCSEHAVVLPALLAWLTWLGPQRPTLVATGRAVLLPAALSALYVAGKLAYFAFVRLPPAGYAPVTDASAWVANLGRFAIATSSLPTLLASEAARPVVGTLVLLALAALVPLARRRGGAFTLPALGLACFVSALLPVLPLTRHYYSYFIGIAAMGMALAVVGACRALPRWGGALAALLVAGLLVTDKATCERASREEPGVMLFRVAQAKSLDLVRSLDQTTRNGPPGHYVHVPDSPLNMSVIGFGGAHRIFFEPPVSVYFGSQGLPRSDIILLSLVPAGDDIPVPGRSPRWDWLRRGAAFLHRPWAAGCG